MTERDKKRLIYGSAAVLVIVVLFLLFGRRAGTTVVQPGSDIALGGVTIPGLNIPGREPFTVPDFGYDPYEGLSAIGACCTDCSNRAPVRETYRPAGTTIVFNEGAKGPNVYNYYTPVTVNPTPPPRGYFRTY